MPPRKSRTSRVTPKSRAKVTRPSRKPVRRAAKPKLKVKMKAKGKARAKKPARTAARRRAPEPKPITTVTLGPHTVDRTHGSQGFHAKPAPMRTAVPPVLQHSATVRHH